MLDDINHVPKRQNIVVVDGMFPRIKGHQVSINLIPSPSRQLGLIVGFKGDDKKPSIRHNNPTWILGRNSEPASNFSCVNIDHCDLIFRGQRHIRLVVTRERNTNWLVKASRQFIVKSLNRRDHIPVRQAVWIIINHAYRI